MNAFENETLRTISARRSIRQFAEMPVSDDVVAKVLDAANCAPSAHNQQSWRFIVVRNEKKQALAELVVDKSSVFPRPVAAILRMAARSITNAPVLIAVVNSGELIDHGMELFKIGKDLGKDFFRTMEIQSSAAAVQNLLLAATSMGLASVWLGILFLLKDEVRAFLGEEKGEFMAVIPVGYPLREANEPRKKPLAYVVKNIG
ncbi:MAG TPA: nitroreductase family protein [Candidatus Omnitrophota bacterium]|nr:nitroreductase family protein [Candidatus Omnitrophota bacterium]HPS20982.1 nitroreductase family protein [Candidatus Omnitrophota bacterium]